MSATAEMQDDTILVTWSCTDSSSIATCVTMVPEAVRGRAAALAVVEAQRIIYLYLERPGD